MISVGVAGLGYWGPNLVRNLAASPRTRLEHFAACIEAGAAPLSGGEQGRRIVRIPEAARSTLSPSTRVTL